MVDLGTASTQRTLACQFIGATLALAATFAGPSGAATMCVGTATELQNALVIAANNDQSDVIQVRIGTYFGNFTYQPPAPGATVDDESLTIRGGYMPFLMGCARASRDPASTILVDPSGARALEITPFMAPDSQAITYRIEGLTLEGASGGLFMMGAGHAAANTFEIIGNVFTGASDGNWAVRVLHAGQGIVKLVNNLIVGNGSTGSLAAGGALIEVLSLTAEVVVVHNTVAGNLISDAGLRLDCSSPAIVDVANNILFGGETSVLGGVDLFINFNCLGTVSYNTIGLWDSNDADDLCCNSDADPLFVDEASANFRLRSGSPALDVGDLTPTGGLPTTDILGGARLVGLLPDRGAYEATFLFNDGFEAGVLNGWTVSP